MTDTIDTNNPPYAVFRFRGETVICMDKRQLNQALRDARLCRCGDCLACRAAEYHRDAQEQN